MKMRIPVRVCAMVGVLVLIGGLTVFLWSRSSAEAHAIVETCVSDATCYEKQVSALFPELSVPDLFDMIREIRRLDPSYQFCHVLAHKLGEGVVAEDPSQWLDAIPLNPTDGLCSNGFIHGVIVGRFRDDSLDEKTLEQTIPDFARACEPRDGWQPTGLDQAMCYHGMGHLFMFITLADIQKSLEVCTRITRSPTGDFSRVCREGVFMQIYQPLEPDDFALVELLEEKPSRENYRRMCAVYARGNAEDEGACLREAWPLFREELMAGTGVAAFCTGQPNTSEEDKCYESALTIIGRQSLGDTTGITAACDAVPEARRVLCYTVAAQAMLEEDRTKGNKALALCQRAPEVIANQCIATLAARAQWLFGNTDERRAFCLQLPAAYRAACGP